MEVHGLHLRVLILLLDFRPPLVVAGRRLDLLPQRERVLDQRYLMKVPRVRDLQAAHPVRVTPFLHSHRRLYASREPAQLLGSYRVSRYTDHAVVSLWRILCGTLYTTYTTRAYLEVALERAPPPERVVPADLALVPAQRSYCAQYIVVLSAVWPQQRLHESGRAM